MVITYNHFAKPNKSFMVESSDPRRSGIVRLLQKLKTSMALPIGSMYGIPSPHLVDFYGTANVGIYTIWV